MIRLNDLYTSWSGLFSNMSHASFLGSFTAADLDIEFFSKYGQRPVSPLVEHFVTSAGNLSDLQKARIAAIIENKFFTQWEHKFAILALEYNPIENYRMEQKTEYKGTETDELSKTGSEKTELSKTGTEETELNKSGSETETTGIRGKETVTESGENEYYGFNSSAASPVNNSERTSETEFENRENETEHTFEDRTDTQTTTFTDRKDTNETTFTNRKDTSVKTFTNREDELTRSGNIGVTTSQQMIQSEIELWKWNFLEDIYHDAASVLALSIYE